MASVVWTGPALTQLDAIAAYIALDKPDAARAVVQRIADAADHVQRFKKLGKVIPEFRHPNYRQVWLKPCWIYYRIEREMVFILHVRRAERPFRMEELIAESGDPADPA